MGFLNDLFGNTAADASTEAAGLQVNALNTAIDQSGQFESKARADLQPFTDAGVQALPGLTGLVQDPNQQKQFIQDNTFFNSLADDATQRVFNNAAARGKVGSGGTAKALQNSILLLGNDLRSQSVDERFRLANLGRGAAGGQATITANAANNISDLITGVGNAQAAGVVGAANAQGAGAGQLLQGGLGLSNLITGGQGVQGGVDSFNALGDLIGGGQTGLNAGGVVSGAVQGINPGTTATALPGANAVSGSTVSGSPLTQIPSPGSISNFANLAPSGFLSPGAGGVTTLGGSAGDFAGVTFGQSGASAATGLNAASLGAAALPVALAAFGASRQSSRKKKGAAKTTPLLRQIASASPEQIQTTRGTQIGYAFTDPNTGQTLYASSKDNLKIGKARGIGQVWSPEANSFGSWGAQTGFLTVQQLEEIQSAQRDEQALDKGGVPPSELARQVATLTSDQAASLGTVNSRGDRITISDLFTGDNERGRR